NYCADLRAAKQDILRDGLAPAFPEILWEDVLANRAVDLDKILTARLAPISNRSQWLECWESYADAVTYAYPHRTAELRVYQRLVSDLFSSIHPSHHDSVIRADISMRNRLAEERMWSFADEDKL
ncbi:hypothetical protein AURDEDRAFT_27358, partial [Auricularia subglabra TFB-10046 SS5]